MESTLTQISVLNCNGVILLLTIDMSWLIVFYI